MKTFFKKNKFGAQRTLCSMAHPHPSKLEASVCELLILREKAGDIRNLKWQHTVRLDKYTKWKVDWSFESSPDWVLCFAEAKGKETTDYRRKLKMWRDGLGPSSLEIWKGAWKRPFLMEIVLPS